MFCFFKYIGYVLISRKAIQSARSVSVNLRAKFRSAVLAGGGAALIGIGVLYILFHTAAEFDQTGFVTFNAQKSVCLAFILGGLTLMLLSRKKTQPLKAPQLPRSPGSPIAPSPVVNQLPALFQMINKEAANFLEQATRPESQRVTTRPPTNERALV